MCLDGPSIQASLIALGSRVRIRLFSIADGSPQMYVQCVPLDVEVRQGSVHPLRQSPSFLVEEGHGGGDECVPGEERVDEDADGQRGTDRQEAQDRAGGVETEEVLGPPHWNTAVMIPKVAPILSKNASDAVIGMSIEWKPSRRTISERTMTIVM